MLQKGEGSKHTAAYAEAEIMFDGSTAQVRDELRSDKYNTPASLCDGIVKTSNAVLEDWQSLVLPKAGRCFQAGMVQALNCLICFHTLVRTSS